jgi:hypothetical protein
MTWLVPSFLILFHAPLAHTPGRYAPHDPITSMTGDLPLPPKDPQNGDHLT